MTTTAGQSPATTVVDRFLEAIAAGRGAEMASLYAPDAELDATVPGWRSHVKGNDAIAKEYSRWFADAARFDELEREALDDGEFVTYLISWEENGVTHSGHHSHRLRIDGGLIRFDRVFCGGRWNADRLAEMATN